MPAGGLDKLTERERRVLRLLASGHTVKSAAVEEAITENAASELLRSARRKLGAGSSREAARFLAANEEMSPKNRNRKSVIPAWPHSTDIPASIDPGALAMIAATLAGSANPPKVVCTQPAQGAEIGPGPLVLSVTYDRPMAPRSYSFCRNTDEGAFPEGIGEQPQLSADGRTYSLACVASAPGTYVVYFNRPPYMAFRDAESGAPAQPFRLEFTVTGG